ncbi:MAG: DUF92 domain-containing protein [Vulcanimicrobiaceae bacterium]
MAWRLRWLRPGGAFAAIFIGTLVYGAGGWRYAAVLLSFFISAAFLSRRNEARGAAQVLANGLVPALCAVGALLTGDTAWIVAFGGAIAAATADTWATEIGTNAGGTPRSIVSGKRMERGLSGGVTFAGSLAQIAGASFIAAAADLAHVTALAIPVAAGGICGSLADSYLGATAQALRYCSGCAQHAEVERHHCGADTTLVRGVAWLTNDGVNLLATVMGAAVGGGLVYFFPYVFFK